MARTSKTASGATNNNNRTPTEDEMAMDSLNIDLFDVGDVNDVVDLNDEALLFDDLDFGVVDDHDDGGSGMDPVAVVDTIHIQPHQHQQQPPPRRTGGVRTSKGPPPFLQNKKSSKKKKRMSNDDNVDDDDDVVRHGNFDENDTSYNSSVAGGIYGLPSRERSKRKKKPTIMYTDSDDTTFTKDLKKQMMDNKRGGGGSGGITKIMEDTSNPSLHHYSSITASSSTLLQSPITSKNHRSTTTSVFSTSPDRLMSSFGNNTLSPTQKKTGKIQRSLPTQRKRKAVSASILTKDGGIITNVNDAMNHSVLSTGVRSSVGQSILSALPTDGATVTTTTTTTTTQTDKPKKKITKTFFPYSSIPSSCLTGKRQRVFTKQPNLQKVNHSILSSSNPLVSKNDITKSSPLARILTKYVLNKNIKPSSKTSKGGNKASSSTKSDKRSVDEQSITFAKNLASSFNKRTLINELKQLQNDLKQQSMFMSKGMVHLSYWCNRKFTTNPKKGSSSTSTAPSSASPTPSNKKQKTSNASNSNSGNATSQPPPSYCSTILKNRPYDESCILPEIISTVFKAVYPQSFKSKPMISISVKVKCKNVKKQEINRSMQAGVPKNSPIGLSFILSKLSPKPSSLSRSSGTSPIKGIIGAPILLSSSSSPIKKVKSPQGKKRSTSTSSNSPNAQNSTAVKDSLSLSSPLSSSNAKSFTTSTTSKPKTYDEMNPKERLDFLKNILSQRATYVEQEMFRCRSKAEETLQHRDAERHKLIELNDVHIYMNVKTLIGIMNNMPYFDDMTPNNVSSALSLIWQPDISPQEMHWSGDVTPIVSLTKEDEQDDGQIRKQLESEDVNSMKENDKVQENEAQVSSHSMYDRLQSMLVDVDESDDDDENYDDDDCVNDDNSDFEENYIIDIENDNDTLEDDADNILDVSRLTLDQRAYIHLRSMHLIDQTCLPSCTPNVIESDIQTENNNRLRDHRQKTTSSSTTKNNTNDDNVNNDCIQNLVQNLKNELYNQHCKTNEISSILQLKADEEIMNLSRKRKKMDEDNHAIVKHSQIVARAKKKREGDIKKLKNKVNNNEQWVPW